MPDWISLQRDFDYDAFANKLWLAALETKGFSEPDRSILAHVLSAQAVWLERVNGGSPTAFPHIELNESEIDRLSEGWKLALAKLEGDPVLEYRRVNGEAHRASVVEIVKQVLYHGTYHRGELRGLCRARNDEEFPETDYIRFALTH